MRYSDVTVTMPHVPESNQSGTVKSPPPDRLSSLASLRELAFLGPRRVPFIDLLLGGISCDPVPLLHLANKLVELAIDDLKVIVGEPAPPFLSSAFHFLPFPLQRI